MTHICQKVLTLGITRWNVLPEYPKPCSPVASSRKFFAVLGTTSSYSLKTIRPAGFELIATSNCITHERISVNPAKIQCMQTYKYVCPRSSSKPDQFYLLCYKKRHTLMYWRHWQKWWVVVRKMPWQNEAQQKFGWTQEWDVRKKSVEVHIGQPTWTHCGRLKKLLKQGRWSDCSASAVLYL